MLFLINSADTSKYLINVSYLELWLISRSAMFKSILFKHYLSSKQP